MDTRVSLGGYDCLTPESYVAVVEVHASVVCAAVRSRRGCLCVRACADSRYSRCWLVVQPPGTTDVTATHAG